MLNESFNVSTTHYFFSKFQAETNYNQKFSSMEEELINAKVFLFSFLIKKVTCCKLLIVNYITQSEK